MYNIDLENEYILVEITNEEKYPRVRGTKERYIIIIHKELKSRTIQTIPALYGWFLHVGKGRRKKLRILTKKQ